MNVNETVSNTGPKVCERCGKRHPTPWMHKGDCPVCFEPADARTLRDRGMCRRCWAPIAQGAGAAS